MKWAVINFYFDHRLGDVRWKLCATDTSGKEHWLAADSSKHFASSLCVRWYSIQLPPLTRLKTLQVLAFLPIFYHRNWTPHVNRFVWTIIFSLTPKKTHGSGEKPEVLYSSVWSCIFSKLCPRSTWSWLHIPSYLVRGHYICEIKICEH